MEEQNNTSAPQDQVHPVSNEDLMHELQLLNERCQHFDDVIQHQIATKDSLIDKLHADLRSFQKDDAERYILQVMKAAIRVRAVMRKQMESPRWDSLSADQLREEYAYVLEDLTDLLENQGIIPFASKPGSAFAPSKQNPKIELTNDPALDKTVKESKKDGYMQGDKLIIPEQVIVYQYKGE